MPKPTPTSAPAERAGPSGRCAEPAAGGELPQRRAVTRLLARSGDAASPLLPATGVIELQRTAGNRAVSRLLQRHGGAKSKKQKRDELDDFLIKRLGRFDLEVAGADWHVSLSAKESGGTTTPRACSRWHR